MKNLALKSKFIVLALTLIFFTSCSKDDDATTIVESPSVTYAATSLNATFFQAGNSSAPTLNWNGNQGNFSLASTINGLSINTTTGIINWTNQLPIGTHNVQVIATNSAGQTTVNLTINNPFQGTFTGTYNSSSFFEMEFNPNGTMLVRANSETSPSTATGTWTMTNDTIEVNYTYDSGGGEYSTSGTLNVGSAATYSGDWFNYHDTVPGNEGGVFEIILN